MSKYKLISIFIVILILVGVIITKQRLNNSVTDWKKYQNTDCGYEIIYPSSWIIRATQYKDPCEMYTDAKCVVSSNLYIKNRSPDIFFKIKKMLFNKPPGDIPPKNQTSFTIGCYQTKFLTVEDWVKQSWLSTNNDASFEKKTLEKIREMEFGTTKIKVFVATESRLHFIYNNHEYGINYESGSKEQLLKDKNILDKILSSFRVLE